MRLPNFVAGTYNSVSPNVDCERCVNWYPELKESAGAKARVVLMPSPGLLLFSAPGGRARQLFEQDGRCFYATGGSFYEIAANGAATIRGLIQEDGRPTTISSNGTQLFITAGGLGYIFDLAANTLTQITAPGFPNDVTHGAYLDGYFIALKAGSQKFYISALLDGTSWDALDYGQISAASDNIEALVADHRELWLLGSKTTEAYYNSGNPDFPFELIQGSLQPQGIAAPFAFAQLDNTLYWLGGNQNGAGVVYRADGYIAARVSNHDVEAAIQSYPTIADATMYSHQHAGHSFLTLCFPTAGRTWRYDVSIGQWHELGAWDGNAYQAHWATTHAYAFGKHLVGDRRNGNIYDMSPDYLDDNGTSIRRMRQSPHLSAEQIWNFYQQFQLDLQAGVGTNAGQGVDPKVMLQWSDDGGHTWSNEYWRSAGRRGEYTRRVYWNRLGKSRDRVFRVVVTDPVFWVLIDAFIQVEAGIS